MHTGNCRIGVKMRNKENERKGGVEIEPERCKGTAELTSTAIPSKRGYVIDGAR